MEEKEMKQIHKACSSERKGMGLSLIAGGQGVEQTQVQKWEMIQIKRWD